MEWQLIETAPKDGSAVLVYPPTWETRKAAIAEWDSDEYAKKPRPYWSRDDDMGRVTISRAKPPTHWMPLPPPPLPDNAGDAGLTSSPA